VKSVVWSIVFTVDLLPLHWRLQHWAL